MSVKQRTRAESPERGDCTTLADCWNPLRSKRCNARAPRTNEERHRTTWRQILDLRGSRLSGGPHPVHTQPLAGSMSAAAFDAVWTSPSEAAPCSDERLVTFANFGQKIRSDLAVNVMMINSCCGLKLCTAEWRSVFLGTHR